MGLKQGIKDYCKCVVANKATLAGYVSLAVYGVCNVIETQTNTPMVQIADQLSQYGALFGLGFTTAGLQTYAFYKRTKNTIEQRKKAGREVPKEVLYLSSQYYCTRAGVNLALKEEGLEHLLEKDDKE